MCTHARETRTMTQNSEHQPSTPDTLSIYEKKSESGRKRQMAVMGGILASLATVGTVGACVASNSVGNKAEATPEPSVEAPVVPGEAEATTTIEPTESTDPTPVETEVSGEIVFDVEPIPADLPAEELAVASDKLWLNWSMSGATGETINATNQGWLEYNDGGLESYISDTAQHNAEPFVEAYFPADWESNQELVDYYQGVIEANQNYIEVALTRTSRGEPLIEVSTSVSDVAELPAPAGERIIEYRVDGVMENSDSEYRGGIVKETYDISDGYARLIAKDASQNL